MHDYLVALIKISSEEDYRKSFINGDLYMNRVKEFIESKEAGIGDIREAVGLCKTYKYFVDDVNVSTNSFLFREKNDELKPIFCMTAITQADLKKNNGIIKIDEKSLQFGEYATVIIDVKEFINRIKRVTPPLYTSMIKYIDFNRVNWPVFNPITKKSKKRYSSQREFRIYSERVLCAEGCDLDIPGLDWLDIINNDHYMCNIDNIDSISYKCNTRDLICGQSIKLKIDWKFARLDNFDLYTKEGWKKNAGDE